MASQGPNYPSAVASGSAAPESAENWLTQTNILADDAAEAQITAATFDSPDVSFRLRVSGFGFSIPAGATIDGIVVEIDRRCFAGTAKDFRVQLGTNLAMDGANKADTVNAWPGTLTVKSYGSSSDTWTVAGINSTYVNSANFSVYFSAQATSANVDIGVDFIRVTVHYTEAAGGGGNPPHRILLLGVG